MSCDITLERMTGIEPALSAWEADVLPLNYTRAARRAGASTSISDGRGRQLAAEAPSRRESYVASSAMSTRERSDIIVTAAMVISAEIRM